MKDFVKMTLAAILGCLTVGAVMTFIMLGIIGSIAALGNTQPVLPREGILTIDMSKITLDEQTVPTDITGVFEGQTRTSMGIWTAVRAIQAAALDPSVKFIYLKPDGTAGEMGCIEELRTSLERFRTSGKAVISYIETPSNASYYLASVSDRIFMSDYDGGMNMLTGFSTQQMFLKDILDRLGINVQLIRHGNKFGVKIHAQAPSINLIKAHIETEIAPIVGSEQQARDLIAYIKENAQTENGVWETNIFGKSVEQIVEDGMEAKIAQMTDDCQQKLQDTLQKIINDSNGGLICIII